MMVDGAEESQLRGPIDLLAPYTTQRLVTLRSGSTVQAKCRTVAHRTPSPLDKKQPTTITATFSRLRRSGPSVAVAG